MEQTQPLAEDVPSLSSRYRLLEKLGEGGMAEVFRAECRGLNGFRRIVALKLVRQHLARQRGFDRLFAREAKIGGYLAHPNIVETLDFGELLDRPFLAMEYVEGPSLETLLYRQAEVGAPIPLDLVLELMIQICEGLDYAHSATDHSGRPLQMVHRDLKPSNILVSRHGLAKIADFGVARVGSGMASTPSSSSLRGTLQYLSPEQAAGITVDQRADLFSLGLVLFEMLTLVRFYEADRVAGLLRLALNADVAPRLESLPELPRRDALLRVLSRVLSREPEARYPTAGALADDLKEIHSSLETRTRLIEWLTESMRAAIDAQRCSEHLRGPTEHRFDFGSLGEAVPLWSDRPGGQTWAEEGRPALWAPQPASSQETATLETGEPEPGEALREPVADLEPAENVQEGSRPVARARGRGWARFAGVALLVGGLAWWIWEPAPGNSRVEALGLTPSGAGRFSPGDRGINGPMVGAHSDPEASNGVAGIPQATPSSTAPGSTAYGRGDGLIGTSSPVGRRATSSPAPRIRSREIVDARPAGRSNGTASPSSFRPLRSGMIMGVSGPPTAKSGSTSDARRSTIDGALALNSFPESAIIVDGVKVDNFPVLNLSAPPGEHFVTFRLPQGQVLSQRIEIAEGRITRCTAYFGEGRVRCREG